MEAKITSIKLAELPDNIKKIRKATHSVLITTEGFDQTSGKMLLSVNNEVFEANTETMKTEVSITTNDSLQTQSILSGSETVRIKGHFVDVETKSISGSVLQEFSLNQNTQQYVKTDNLLKTSDVILGNYDKFLQDLNGKETLLDKMKKKGIEELYYVNNVKGKQNAFRTVILHYKIVNNVLFREIIPTVLKINYPDDRLQYIEFEKKFRFKIYSVSGHLLYKPINEKLWRHKESKKFEFLPHHNSFYIKNSLPSVNDDRQISLELNDISDYKPEKVDFDALSKSVQSQLEKAFYNNVNMHVYIKQLDENGNKIKENYLKSNQKSQNFDIKLNITINHKGEVEIKHVASDNYMKPYVNKLKQEAEARGLEVDIEALRKKCINDFEAPETEKTFFQNFIQGTKAIFSDKIAGYLEGVQVSQKIAKNVWSEGAINQSTWHTKNSEHTKWPEYARLHPVVGGVTDGAVDEIVGIPMAVKGIYEIITDEEKQESLKKIFTKEGASQMMEGLANEAQETLNDKDKAQHFSGKTVVSVATMLSGAGLLTKARKMDDALNVANDISKPFTNYKTFNAVENLKKTNRYIPEENKAVEKIIKETDVEVLDELGDDLTKILRKGEDASVLKKARNLPGTAVGSGKEIKGKWLKGSHGNAASFPKSITEKLKGKEFKNFDEFRGAFWKAVSEDEQLTSQFRKADVTRMKGGLAPYVSNTQNIRKNNKYVLHHITPINRGGGVYDMDNLYIVTPKFHKEILNPAYHYGYGY